MTRDRIQDSLRQAAKLASPLSSSVRRADPLSHSDHDLYQFGLGSRSNLTLQVSHQGKKAIAGVQLFALKQAKATIMRTIGRKSWSDLNSREIRNYLQPIARTTLKNRQDRTLNLTLDAGEYYVRMFHQRGNASRYQLAVSATALPAPISAPTPSISPIPAPIPAPTPDPSSTPIPSPSPAPSPIPTPNPSPNPAPNPAPSPIPTPDPSPSPNPTPSPTPTLSLLQKWIKQWGGLGNDYGYGTAIDTMGNVYAAGVTGEVGSTAGTGTVAQYSSDGTLNWQRTLPFDGSEIAFDIAVDGAGNYYVAGAANVSTASFPTSDGFVAKYDSNGNELWRQTIASTVSLLGFGSRAALDAASGIAIDSEGNVLITGFTGALPGFGTTQGDAFIAKYSGSNGAVISEFGNAGRVLFGGSGADTAAKLAIDSEDNVYITGITNATLTTDTNQPYANGDAYVVAYSKAGSLLWQDLLSSGTTQDYGRGIAVSGDRVYITGQTEGALPDNSSAGGVDGFFASYNRITGDRQWVKQFGTSGLDESQGIAVDSAGNLYLTGETTQSLFGAALGGSDAWIARYDQNGSLLQSTQFGTAAADEAYGIRMGVNGKLYAIGQTFGAFPNQTNQGDYDAWIASYELVSSS
ncbi:MAG: hypothetical protein Kow00121_19690 [Elainellaceae cyanobacterium]